MVEEEEEGFGCLRGQWLRVIHAQFAAHSLQGREWLQLKLGFVQDIFNACNALCSERIIYHIHLAHLFFFLKIYLE